MLSTAWRCCQGTSEATLAEWPEPRAAQGGGAWGWEASGQSAWTRLGLGLISGEGHPSGKPLPCEPPSYCTPPAPWVWVQGPGAFRWSKCPYLVTVPFSSWGISSTEADAPWACNLLLGLSCQHSRCLKLVPPQAQPFSQGCGTACAPWAVEGTVILQRSSGSPHAPFAWPQAGSSWGFTAGSSFVPAKSRKEKPGSQLLALHLGFTSSPAIQGAKLHCAVEFLLCSVGLCIPRCSFLGAAGSALLPPCPGQLLGGHQTGPAHCLLRSHQQKEAGVHLGCFCFFTLLKSAVMSIAWLCPTAASWPLR